MAYRSQADRRKARKDLAGMAIIAAVALVFGATLYGAARADAARGISVSQSLQQAGL